jgi:TonB family protein
MPRTTTALRLAVTLLISGILVHAQSGSQSASKQQINAAKPALYTLQPLTPLAVAYPAGQNLTVDVIAILAISETGLVERVTVFDSPNSSPQLNSAVEAAAQPWKFQPVMQDGRPIPVLAKLTVGFNGEKREATTVLAPATAFPDHVRISEGVSRGLLIKKVAPSYPPDALAKGLEGNVLLKAVIDKTGAVTNLELISGNPAFVQAAMDAVRQWQYRPYLLYGHPVPVWTQMQVNFTLRGR